jgi:hypothetical protein
VLWDFLVMRVVAEFAGRQRQGADQRYSANELLRRIAAAICALNGRESLSWVQAYCDTVADRAR